MLVSWHKVWGVLETNKKKMEQKQQKWQLECDGSLLYFFESDKAAYTHSN